MDSKMYPQGTTPHYSKYVNGVLKFFKRSTQAEISSIDGVAGVAYEAGKAYTVRRRITLAEVNAGITLLAAIPGYKYRMVDATFLAYGGNAAGLTSVDINATQGTAKVLLAAAVGGLNRSVLLKPDTTTHAAVLADGASFAVCDANTAITVKKVGSDLTTATGVDLTFTYEIVRA